MDYKEFLDEVEAIFTVPGLEKMPTVDPQPYTPTLLMDANTLLPEEEQILKRTLHRIAERVRCVLLYMYVRISVILFMCVWVDVGGCFTCILG